MTEEGERLPRHEDEEAVDDAEVLVWNGLVTKPSRATPGHPEHDDIQRSLVAERGRHRDRIRTGALRVGISSRHPRVPPAGRLL